MSGRQHGKSIFGSTITHAWVDEAAELFEGLEAPIQYLEYNSNPLALVCAMLRSGKQGYEAGETLKGIGQNRPFKQINFNTVIEQQDIDRADEITSYFATKHTMRRLKNEWVSEYMLAIDEIAENPLRINKEHIGILVSLPRIYEQNRSLERVMKGHKSAPKPNSLTYPAMEGVVEFVEKIHVKHGHKSQVHYYFSTANNYLMRFVVEKNEYGETAWDTLSQAGKLHISSDATFMYNIKGYDFNVLQANPANVEIKIL